MQSFASRSLPSSPMPRAAHHRAQPVVALPSPRDERYPRAWWLRVVRGIAGVWWIPLALYVGSATALLFVTQTRTDAAPLTLDTAASALGFGDALDFFAQEPWALIGSVTLVVALIGGALWLQHLAAVDRRREVTVLMLRQAQSSELENPTWMRDALFPALRWRLHTLLRWRILLQCALLLAMLLVGAVLGMLFSGSLLAGAIIH
jgi:hypothetical protein